MLGPDEPGMRSRIAPKARAPPVPSACTPDTSRVAIPAIFRTTESAIDVRPCEVARSPRLGWALASAPPPAPPVVVEDAVSDVVVMGPFPSSPPAPACRHLGAAPHHV